MDFGHINPTYLTLYEQNCWFMTDQMTSSLCIFEQQQRGNGVRTTGGREKGDARDLRLTTFPLSPTFDEHSTGLEFRPTLHEALAPLLGQFLDSTTRSFTPTTAAPFPRKTF